MTSWLRRACRYARASSSLSRTIVKAALIGAVCEIGALDEAGYVADDAERAVVVAAACGDGVGAAGTILEVDRVAPSDMDEVQVRSMRERCTRAKGENLTTGSTGLSDKMGMWPQVARVGCPPRPFLHR